MKRVLSVILVIILLLALPLNLSICAASNTYDIDELELQVTIPTGYSVITRDTPASAPIFSVLGTSKSTLMKQFESGHIYLNAISDTYNEEVVVTMGENGVTDFNQLSDTVLDTFASTLANEYLSYGIKVSKYEIYNNSAVKFVRLYFTDTGNTVNGLQYCTVHNGKTMNFTMRSYEGSLSSRQKTAIKSIVDSIKYDIEPLTLDLGEDSDSFVHTDIDSGVTFTVPANWKQEAFNEDREFIDVKFASIKEEGCIIIYSSADMWEEMTADEKVGYLRSDINNSLLTKADIAEMCNTTSDKITMVTYNGVQYFKGESTYTMDVYGIDVTATMTQLIYVDNGWMYMFQFGGTSSHKLYSDFESLLTSVQYPTTSTNEASTSTGIFGLLPTLLVSFFVFAIFLVVPAVIVIVVIAVVMSQKKKPPTTKPVVNQPINPNPINITSSECYCRNCGQALPLDSDFCHICGTKVVKE